MAIRPMGVCQPTIWLIAKGDRTCLTSGVGLPVNYHPVNYHHQWQRLDLWLDKALYSEFSRLAKYNLSPESKGLTPIRLPHWFQKRCSLDYSGDSQ
jgi:hypothetical protein